MSSTILLWQIAVVNPVDPLARQVREGSKVVVGRQQLDLRPAHLAGRCAAALDSLATGDPAHHRIPPQPVGVIHVFVPSQATIERLTQETDNAMPCQPFLPDHLGQSITGQGGQPEGFVEFTIGEQPGV